MVKTVRGHRRLRWNRAHDLRIRNTGIVALQASSIEFVKHIEHVEMSRNSRGVKRTFSYASFVAIKYAGIIDINVAKYLFFRKLIFVAEPNSVIIYRCILVAESSVVAANDTTRTAISVSDNDSDNPIC